MKLLIKIFSILIFFLSTTFSLCQKKYEFDYLIEYKFTNYQDSLGAKTISRYYLTNSNNSSYLALITNSDSLNYQMTFKDVKGITFNTNYLKSDFIKAEIINVDCYYISPYHFFLKNRINEYDFFNRKDTIINNTNYRKYELYSTKPKKRKRKKLASEVYIVNKNTDFHKPILHLPLAYAEWESKKNIPDGIFKERLLIDYYGNILNKEEIVGYHKIKKAIIIDSKCDYTKK
ncbi:MAG: hypothetical protein CMC76_07895 [Flavobacteriaceae bacterium]|nr:hypothetical protein [Flavobacteriaceae bacterium]|tara:strand:+ start:164 stop:859 length:696 start_codon:yes stop_codon:yes gene_type:complete